MTEITSKDNAVYKLAVKLKNKKYRDALGMFLVEGKRAVADVLSARPELAAYVFVSDSAADMTGGTVMLPEKLFSGICETDSSQGIVAALKKPKPVPCGGNALYLDRVRDPGNIGTLIRTAVAAGFFDIYLYDCADAFSGKVVRSTMSAVVKANIFEHPPEIAELKAKRYKIICADAGGKDAYGYRADGEKICLVIGNEANGISSGLKGEADEILSLPMVGDIESLNAAVCGSILMYNLKYLK